METKKVEGPPSPARPPVDLANCVEELVKYTLYSSVNGTLEIDLGLSKDYCSALLKDDHLTDPTSISTGKLYIRTISSEIFLLLFGCSENVEWKNKEMKFWGLDRTLFGFPTALVSLRGVIIIFVTFSFSFLRGKPKQAKNMIKKFRVCLETLLKTQNGFLCGVLKTQNDFLCGVLVVF